MEDKTEALLVQLSSSYQDRCRLYLNECLQELTQRFELFQRQALDDLLRGCLALCGHTFEPSVPGPLLMQHEVDTDCGRRLDPPPPGPVLVLQPKQERCVSISSPGDISLPSTAEYGCEFGKEEREQPAERSPEPQPRRSRFPRIRPKRLGMSRRPRVDPEMRAELAIIIGHHPTISIARLNTELRLRLPRKPTVSDDVIRRVARGVFFTLEDDEEAAEAGEARRYALWLQERSREAGGPRLVFLGEWLFNVFLRRPTPAASLLVALSAASGVESHRLGHGRAPAALLASFAEAVVGRDRACVLVLEAKLRQHAARLAEATGCSVKILPPGQALSPLREACTAWRAEMERRLGAESARSLLHDVQMAPASSNGAAADLLGQVLRQHAEAALASVTPAMVRGVLCG